MNMLPRNWQRKELKIPSFRKSLDSAPIVSPDLDTEAKRKAAAWAWHQRAGGDPSPKRTVVESVAAVSRKRMVGRPKSRFEVESARETPRISSSKSKCSLETDLFDAFDISTIARQVAQFARRSSRDEHAPNFSSERREGVCKLDQPFSSLGVSNFGDSRKQLSKERDGFGSFSFSRTRRRSVNSEFAVPAPGVSQVSSPDFRIGGVTSQRKSRVKELLFRILKVSGKGKRCSVDSSKFDALEQVQNHHHYHHHHHFHYHHMPDEDTEILDTAKVRRRSESFAYYYPKPAGPEGQEMRQQRRRSEDFTLKCKGHGGLREGEEVEHYYYHWSPDKRSEDDGEGRRFRRYSGNFGTEKTTGLLQPRVRRHSADIPASYLASYGYDGAEL